MSGELRVVHVLWALDIGGAERALFQLVREQRRRGMVADVATGRSAGFYGDLVRQSGAQVHEFRQRRALDLSARARIVSVFGRYDIVHFHAAEVGLIHLAARTPARRYYTHRAGAFAYPWKQRLRYEAAGWHFRRNFAGLSANTEHARRAAARLFRIPVEQILTTPNGIELGLLTPNRPPEDVLRELGADDDGTMRVAVAASLRAIKRVDRLLRAIPLAGTPIRCYVFGDGPERERLVALARQLGIADRVVFAGTQPHVADYLQVMDAFVLPTGPEESFGNAVVEAMAMGLPVAVFADGGGLIEHVRDGETGFVVPDVDALARTLARLARDAALRSRVGAAARETVRTKYTLARMADAYERLYAGSGRVNAA